MMDFIINSIRAGCVPWRVSLRMICRSIPRCCQTHFFLGLLLLRLPSTVTCSSTLVRPSTVPCSITLVRPSTVPCSITLVRPSTVPCSITLVRPSDLFTSPYHFSFRRFTVAWRSSYDVRCGGFSHMLVSDCFNCINILQAYTVSSIMLHSIVCSHLMFTYLLSMITLCMVYYS